MPGEFYIEGKKEKLDLAEIRNIVSEMRQAISAAADFWSEPVREIQVGATPTTIALPGVAVSGLPSAIPVVRAVAMLKFRMVGNTSSSQNGLSGSTVPGVSQVIQAGSGGSWADAIGFADGQFSLEGQTREGGDVCIGSFDVSGVVRGNGSYRFRWLLGRASEDYLSFSDVQVGLRLWYRMEEA